MRRVAQAGRGTGVAEGMAAIGAAVVGHDPLDRDAIASEPGEGPLEEGDGADGASGLRHRTEPERPACAQVGAVASSIDAHRCGEPAGTPSEIENSRRAAVTHHRRDPLQRLKGAEQDTGTDPGQLAADIKQIRDTVGAVDISVAALEKQRSIARRRPMERVAARIADDIGFGFNDAAADPAFREIVGQHPANEFARQLDGINWQLRAPKSTYDDGVKAHRKLGSPGLRAASFRLGIDALRHAGGPCARLERIAEVLRLADHLAVFELHDADGVGRLVIVEDDVFSDREVADACNSPNLKALLLCCKVRLV